MIEPVTDKLTSASDGNNDNAISRAVTYKLDNIVRSGVQRGITVRFFNSTGGVICSQTIVAIRRELVRT